MLPVMDARYVAAAAAVAAAATAAAVPDNTRLSPLSRVVVEDHLPLPPLKSNNNNSTTVTTTTTTTTNQTNNNNNNISNAITSIPLQTTTNSSPSIVTPPTTTTTTTNSPDMPVAIYDIAKLLAAKCVVFKGKVYNVKGHPICGVLNQHDRPCHRIGRCPFHFYSTPVSTDNVCNGNVDADGSARPDQNSAISRSTSYDPGGLSIPSNNEPPLTPPKKMQYKHGWTKEEHYLFLLGLRTHGRGAWKQIANEVKTRTPTQVQSHAQKFYLRQKQQNKNKRSIHDLTLDSPEMLEIEKQLVIDPNNRIGNIHHQHHQHNGHNAFDDFPSIFPVNTNNNQHDVNRSIALSPLDRASVAAAGFPLNFRGPITSNHQRNQNQQPIVAPPPPWYATTTRSPVHQHRTTHDWSSAASMPLDNRYAEKRADALLDAATATPLRAQPQAADSLLYGTSATTGYGANTTYGSTTASHHGDTTAQSYEEARAFGGQDAPSTSVLLAHGDGVSDMLRSIKGISKPLHHQHYRNTIRSQRRQHHQSHQLLSDPQPFDSLTSPVTTQHSIPHGFLSGVDLTVNEHPGEVQQPPRDVGALLSGVRAVSTAQNER